MRAAHLEGGKTARATGGVVMVVGGAAVIAGSNELRQRHGHLHQEPHSSDTSYCSKFPAQLYLYFVVIIRCAVLNEY